MTDTLRSSPSLSKLYCISKVNVPLSLSSIASVLSNVHLTTLFPLGSSNIVCVSGLPAVSLPVFVALKLVGSVPASTLLSL